MDNPWIFMRSLCNQRLWTFVTELSEQGRILALDVGTYFATGQVTNFGQASGEPEMVILFINYILSYLRAKMILAWAATEIFLWGS